MKQLLIFRYCHYNSSAVLYKVESINKTLQRFQAEYLSILAFQQSSLCPWTVKIRLSKHQLLFLVVRNERNKFVLLHQTGIMLMYFHREKTLKDFKWLWQKVTQYSTSPGSSFNAHNSHTIHTKFMFQSGSGVFLYIQALLERLIGSWSRHVLNWE